MGRRLPPHGTTVISTAKNSKNTQKLWREHPNSMHAIGTTFGALLIIASPFQLAWRILRHDNMPRFHENLLKWERERKNCRGFCLYSCEYAQTWWCVESKMLNRFTLERIHRWFFVDMVGREKNEKATQEKMGKESKSRNCNETLGIIYSIRSKGLCVCMWPAWYIYLRWE